MKKQISHFFILCLLFSFFSCSMSIEKRRYRPGYHIDVIAKKNNEHRGKDIRLGEYEIEISRLNPDPLITVKDSSRVSKEFVRIGQMNPAGGKRKISTPILPKQEWNKYRF